MTGNLLKVRDAVLAPDYQPGDHVWAVPASSAETGQVCVVGFEDGSTGLRRWPVEGARVLGVVVEMYRRLT